MVYVKVLFFVGVALVQVQAVQPPPWLRTCKRSDPKLGECAVKSGQLAIPHLVQGNKTLQLPNMQPLHITSIDFQASNNLVIVLRNLSVYDLEGVIVKRINIQFDKNKMTYKVFIPRVQIISQYSMNGRILILPIRGDGNCNITAVNGTFTYYLNFYKIHKKGKDYLGFGEHSMDFDLGRVYYHFENLFGGNSALGKQMNVFLDENWEAVTADMGKAISETVSAIVTSIASGIFLKVPFDDVFPE